jgi:hypothetical protein
MVPRASSPSRLACNIGQYTTQCALAKDEEHCGKKWVSNTSDPHKGLLCKWEGNSCHTTTNDCNVSLALIRRAAQIHFNRYGVAHDDRVSQRLKKVTDGALPLTDNQVRKDYANAVSAFLHGDRRAVDAFLNKLRAGGTASTHFETLRDTVSMATSRLTHTLTPVSSHSPFAQAVSIADAHLSTQMLASAPAGGGAGGARPNEQSKYIHMYG